MFQQVFRAQSEGLLVLPLIALGIFVTVYAVRVLAILRADPAVTEAHSRLPLEDDHHA
jgi:hypothetical protein